MKFNKKGSEMTMVLVVSAVIVLVILVVSVSMYKSKVTLFNEATECINSGGYWAEECNSKFAITMPTPVRKDDRGIEKDFFCCKTNGVNPKAFKAEAVKMKEEYSHIFSPYSGVRLLNAEGEGISFDLRIKESTKFTDKKIHIIKKGTTEEIPAKTHVNFNRDDEVSYFNGDKLGKFCVFNVYNNKNKKLATRNIIDCGKAEITLKNLDAPKGVYKTEIIVYPKAGENAVQSTSINLDVDGSTDADDIVVVEEETGIELENDLSFNHIKSFKGNRFIDVIELNSEGNYDIYSKVIDKDEGCPGNTDDYDKYELNLKQEFASFKGYSYPMDVCIAAVLSETPATPAILKSNFKLLPTNIDADEVIVIKEQKCDTNTCEKLSVVKCIDFTRRGGCAFDDTLRCTFTEDNQCKNCADAEITTCADYKGEASCLGNECFDSKCFWDENNQNECKVCDISKGCAQYEDSKACQRNDCNLPIECAWYGSEWFGDCAKN